MNVRSATSTVYVIFDAELSAYDAALSEGWPLQPDRTEAPDAFRPEYWSRRAREFEMEAASATDAHARAMYFRLIKMYEHLAATLLVRDAE